MLAKLISSGRPLLADRATGANLFEAGPASGENSEVLSDRRPERIRVAALGPLVSPPAAAEAAPRPRRRRSQSA